MPECGRAAIKGLRPTLVRVLPLLPTLQDLVWLMAEIWIAGRWGASLSMRRRAMFPRRITQYILVRSVELWTVKVGGLIHCLICRIRDVFARLGTDAPEAMFFAICAEDSSIVYYKISKGVVKPPV